MAHYHLFIASGQSNMSAYSPMGVLKESGLSTNPGDPGDAPAYVPGYQQTDANEWTGAPPASIDTDIQYVYPNATDHPSLYIENTSGALDRVFDAWGTHDKHFPQYPSGDLDMGGSYGMELSFLQRARAANPTWNLACIKQSVGGSSIRANWLPPTVTLGTAQSGSSNTIQLESGNFYDPTDLLIKITGGTGAGQTATCSSYNSGTKTATISGSWTTAPDNTSTYGLELLQTQILRVMIEQAFARLTGAGHTYECVFIWMQGESGTPSTSDDSQYLSDARALFAYVRSICGDASMPVIVGRLGDNWGWETDPNPYLVTAGYPYAVSDFTENATDGRIAGTSEFRATFLTGTVARRATQVTLGGDANCAWFNNDGYPVMPPYDLTPAENDLSAYHWAGPGNLAAGERAYDAYAALTAPTEFLCISTSAGVLAIGI
jgi:hypothetical protein